MPHAERTMLGNRCVARAEWRWVVLWSLLALTLANAPNLLGWALSTPEMQFGGAVYGVEDANSYLAKMRQGAQGAWLFHLPYTVESHPGTAIYVFYLLSGKLAAGLGLPLAWVYQGARLLCGLLLLLAIYGFFARYTPLRAVRRVAFLLATFSGGLGWLLVVLNRPGWLGSLPLDLVSPEAYPFLTLYSPPHLALATAGLLWGTVRVADGAAQRRARAVWAGAAALLGVALIGAFYLVVPYAVLALDWLVTACRRRRPDWQGLGWIGLACLPGALILAYDATYLAFDPVYRVWTAQNLVPALHPLHYVAGYALPGVLAGTGIWRLVRRRQGRLQLPLVWLAATPLFLAAPFGAARRLIVGAPVALYLFAALGWVYGILLPFGRSRLVRWLSRYPRYSRPGMRRWLTAGLLLLLVPTNLLLVVRSSIEVAQRQAPIFHHQDELAALDWLGAHTRPEDAVLCAYESGNYLPARAGNRVLLGLGPETIYAERKRGEVHRFFDPATTDDWRQRLLAGYGIAYLLHGPAERALGAFDPQQASYLDLVYANDRYRIYQVDLP